MVHFVKLNETVPSPPDFNFRQNIKVLDHRCCSQHTSLVLIDEKMWLHFRKKPMFQTILLRMFRWLHQTKNVVKYFQENWNSNALIIGYSLMKK